MKSASLRVSPGALSTFYATVAGILGAPPDEARVFASCLLRADLRGKHTQGAALLPYLVSLVRDGLARFDAPWSVVSDTGPAVVADGGYGLGSVVATRAMDLAVERAVRYAIGCVWVRNGGDFAMASNHVLQATDRGMVGVAMRNGNPRVAPWGGYTAAFGTDPVAVGVPCDEKPPMVVVDMAAGSYSVGQTIMAARDGRKWTTNSSRPPTVSTRMRPRDWWPIRPTANLLLSAPSYRRGTGDTHGS